MLNVACADIPQEIRFSASHLRILYSSRSFPINFIHISFWPPLGFFTFLSTSFSASVAGVYSFNLRRWPYHFILHSLITSLQGLRLYFLSSSMFVILSCQCMLKIFFIAPLWKISIFFTSSLFKVHNCIGKHFLCRLLDFLFLFSLMLTCFPEYFSVWCKLLLLKLLFSLCPLLYLNVYVRIAKRLYMSETKYHEISRDSIHLGTKEAYLPWKCYQQFLENEVLINILNLFF